MIEPQEPLKPQRKVNVLIIGRHNLFGTTLQVALSQYEIEATRLSLVSVEHILEAAALIEPGVAVVDLHLGPTDLVGRPVHGLGAVAALAQDRWEVIVLSNSSDMRWVAAAISAGAAGFVPKSASFKLLLDAVLACASGRPVLGEADRWHWIQVHRRHVIDEQETDARVERLSVREREVLELLADGYRAAAIAEKFVVSMTTVRAQIRSILTKLGVRSQLEAVAVLRRQEVS